MEAEIYLENLGEEEQELVLYDGETYTTGEVRKLIMETLGVLGEQGGNPALNDEDRGTSVDMSIRSLLGLLAFVTMEDVTALKRLDDNTRFFAVRTLEALRTLGISGAEERQGLRVLQYLLKGYVGCGQ